MPNALYNVVLILGMVVAVLFSVLVFLTSKGDAMSGGSNIRTTFKGKTGIDELIPTFADEADAERALLD